MVVASIATTINHIFHLHGRHLVPSFSMPDIGKTRTTDMDDKNADEGQEAAYLQNNTGTDVGIGIDDAAAIPKGEIDPVYEAKARVLNRAAS